MHIEALFKPDADLHLLNIGARLETGPDVHLMDVGVRFGSIFGSRRPSYRSVLFSIEMCTFEVCFARKSQPSVTQASAPEPLIVGCAGTMTRCDRCDGGYGRRWHCDGLDHCGSIVEPPAECSRSTLN